MTTGPSLKAEVVFVSSKKSDYPIIIACRHWVDITARAIESIRKYADNPIILVDDASPHPDSKRGFEELACKYKSISLIRNATQSQHGRSVDYAINELYNGWFFTCDNDVIIQGHRAFECLLDKIDDDVAAIGQIKTNELSSTFGGFISPHWALWNAEAIERHNLSFAPFGIKRRDEKKPLVFATAQFLCYRLTSLVNAPWDVKDRKYKLVSVNLKGVLTHDQAWRRRGDTWKQEVSLTD